MTKHKSATRAYLDVLRKVYLGTKDKLKELRPITGESPEITETPLPAPHPAPGVSRPHIVDSSKVNHDTLNQIIFDIMRDEGFRENPYTCTAGVWTIGWGRTEGVTKDTKPTTREKEYPLLLQSIDTAINDADILFANFSGLDPVRQGVLVNMAFNLGRSRLSRFVNLRRAVEDEDFELAAMHMRMSKWFHQVGVRSEYLEKRMRTGEIEHRHVYRNTGEPLWQ